MASSLPEIPNGNNNSIGASMVDYIHRHSNTSSTLTDQHHEQRRSSLLSDVVDSTYMLGDSHRNILLLGPPKSGRTSLAMEMAHSIASVSSVNNLQCTGQCHWNTTDGGGGVSSVCKCVAVTLIVYEQQHQQQYDVATSRQKQSVTSVSSFPLPCRYVSSQTDLQSKLKVLDDHIYDNGSNSKNQYQKEALGRIQVQHLTSTRELLDYLFRIQSLPLHQQPWGGIIIDDLESFVLQQREQQGNTLSTEHWMKVTQILAILADTANTLRRVSHNKNGNNNKARPVWTALAILNSTLLPKHVERICTTYMPTVVRLCRQSEPTNVYNNHVTLASMITPPPYPVMQLQDGDSVVSKWNVNRNIGAVDIHLRTEAEHSNASINQNEIQSGSTFSYSVVQREDESFHIVWTTGDVELATE